MTRPLLRLWHLLVGHPDRDVEWGNLAEGGRCRACGAQWGRWDYP